MRRRPMPVVRVVAGSGRCANSVPISSSRRARPPRASNKIGHRLNVGRGDLLILLRHDHDAQRLYAPFAAAEIGGVSGRFPANNFNRLCGALR